MVQVDHQTLLDTNRGRRLALARQFSIQRPARRDANQHVVVEMLLASWRVLQVVWLPCRWHFRCVGASIW